jgi:V/A-type H+-transporting ATPase subunit I
VTVIAPRSEYEAVARALAEFEDFHRIEQTEPNFDPVLQELTVKAVRLFALADQAVKDLGIQLMPGSIDIVFRGVKIPRRQVQAKDWDDLLQKAEAELNPIADNVRLVKAQLQKVVKQEIDAATLKEALGMVSNLSLDVGSLSGLQRLRAVLVTMVTENVQELSNSLPDAIVLSQKLGETHSLVLVVVQKAEEPKLDRTMKALGLKPLSIPSSLPQNPAEAFRRLAEEEKTAAESKAKLEESLQQIKAKDEASLLSVRELVGLARDVLDEARVSGGMKRLALISGYVPSKREAEFTERFAKWMVRVEPVGHEEHKGNKDEAPTLLANGVGLKTFELITAEQGTPGLEEVDPTPLVAFVFPIFFGLMFGDVGHGIILTLFALLVRSRGTGSLRQWGNLFLVAGISGTVFGALVGEFFGSALNLYQVLAPVTIHQIEILQHPLGVDAIDVAGIQNVMIIAILIGIAHLVTGLSLDVYEGWKAGEKTEVMIGKLPTLTMYISGVAYGLAFIGAGYSFNVLKTSVPAPLLGIPNNVLGGASLAVVFASMLALLFGKPVAIATGRMTGGSVGGALFDGGLEVFERISQFLSNTISYVRLAVMLVVHAVLLLVANKYFGPAGIAAPWPEGIPIWIILNCLIIAFEAFVVYVQDLRLHIYEFFTKFYRGTGTPFRKILPDRARIDLKWV